MIAGSRVLSWVLVNPQSFPRLLPNAIITISSFIIRWARAHDQPINTKHNMNPPSNISLLLHTHIYTGKKIHGLYSGKGEACPARGKAAPCLYRRDAARVQQRGKQAV